ncbi:hypothetical protein AB4142_35970, partial [Variovorax sp. 2RAF20]
MGTATVLRDAASALVAEETVEDFAEKVQRLLCSTELRTQLAAAGPSDAIAWGADGMTRKVEALYAR